MIFSVVNNDVDKTSTLLMVIEVNNLERMGIGDPLTILPKTYGGKMPKIDYPDNVGLIVCYEPEPGEVYRLLNEEGIGKLIPYLMRGWTSKSDDGKVYPLQGRHEA